MSQGKNKKGSKRAQEVFMKKMPMMLMTSMMVKANDLVIDEAATDPGSFLIRKTF
jgi:hypothetical protein